jgi:hypothetical protein
MVRRTIQIPPTSPPGFIAAPTEVFTLLAPECAFADPGSYVVE